MASRFWFMRRNKIQTGGAMTRKVLTATYHQVSQAQLLTFASSLAYTTILSIVPLLAISFAVFQVFGGLEKLYKIVAPLILSRLTEDSSEQAIGFLNQFIGNVHAGLFGIGGFIGVAVTSMSMLWSIEKAINQVWQVRPRESVFQRLAYYWFFITLGPLALSVAVGIAISSDVALSRILPNGTGMVGVGVGFFFVIYKWVPNTRVNTLSALIASVFTVGFWSLARTGYQLYTRQIVSYNKIYGSLGAVPLLLLWIYILWVIVLIGAALTAALQKELFSHSKI